MVLKSIKFNIIKLKSSTPVVQKQNLTIKMLWFVDDSSMLSNLKENVLPRIFEDSGYFLLNCISNFSPPLMLKNYLVFEWTFEIDFNACLPAISIFLIENFLKNLKLTFFLIFKNKNSAFFKNVALNYHRFSTFSFKEIYYKSYYSQCQAKSLIRI